MVASQASCEAIWLRKLLVGLFGQELPPTIIHCDNQSCIKLSENPVFHDRSKYIEIRYHFIRDWVQRGSVQIQYIPTDEQVADILTKALPRGKHVYFRDKMGLVRNTFLGKSELSFGVPWEVVPLWLWVSNDKSWKYIGTKWVNEGT
jgi:hypothetical protein